MSESSFSLPIGEIHLWEASLASVLKIARIGQLGAVEQAHFSRLKSRKAGDEFLVSRWLTRKILALYLACEPTNLVCGTSDHGKPYLIPDVGLYFNRSHSGDQWALAISPSPQIGVDIERIRERLQESSIVERWFTVEEKVSFSELPTAEKTAYFYECWTRKEAILKAEGLGLAHLERYPELREKYFSQSFTPAEGYAGCVAAEIDSAPASPRIVRRRVCDLP